MNIKMLNGNILTELQSEEKIDGLYMPDNKSYKIVKVVESENEEMKKDSILYVLKSSGTELEINEVKYLVVNIREIILMI